MDRIWYKQQRANDSMSEMCVTAEAYDNNLMHFDNKFMANKRVPKWWLTRPNDLQHRPESLFCECPTEIHKAHIRIVMIIRYLSTNSNTNRERGGGGSDSCSETRTHDKSVPQRPPTTSWMVWLLLRRRQSQIVLAIIIKCPIIMIWISVHFWFSCSVLPPIDEQTRVAFNAPSSHCSRECLFLLFNQTFYDRWLRSSKCMRRHIYTCNVRCAVRVSIILF